MTILIISTSVAFYSHPYENTAVSSLFFAPEKFVYKQTKENARGSLDLSQNVYTYFL